MKRLLICALLMPAFGCGSTASSSGSSARAEGSLVVKVTAGPTCPAQQVSTACAPRSVKGAQLRLQGPSDQTIVSDDTGVARADALPAGVYQLTPQPVAGLMSTPSPTQVVVSSGDTAHAVVTYDTGIR